MIQTIRGPVLGPPTPDPSAEIDLSRFRDALAVVILPTLNEEQGLARTLEDLPLHQFDELGRRVETLVVDGGSTDDTLKVAHLWDIPVLKQAGRGKGGAVLEAVAWVHRLGIPFAVVLDADATYPADRILPALDLLRGGTDLVIGVRHPAWGPPSNVTDLVHRLGNLGMSYAASLLSRRPILDLCSGFWGVSTERFMQLELDDSSFAIEAELVLRAVRRGFIIHQIPVDYHERVGHAKLRAFRDGSRILRTILREARRARRPDENGFTPDRWGRDLLSIALTLGTSGALLECAPSGAFDARQIARYLRPNLPGTRVRVGGPVPAHGSSANVGVQLPPAEELDSASSASPLSVSLPSEGAYGGEGQSATVSIRYQSRELTIELLPNSTEVDSDPSTSIWSRSGGWKGSSLPHRATSPSLLVLTSRLNFQPEQRQRTLLSANGYHLVPQPENAPSSTRPSALETIARAT